MKGRDIYKRLLFLIQSSLQTKISMGSSEKPHATPKPKKVEKTWKKNKGNKKHREKTQQTAKQPPKKIKSRLFRNWGASPRLPKTCSCVYFCLFSRVVVWWFPCCLFHGSCLTLLCSVSLWLLFVLPKGFQKTHCWKLRSDGLPHIESQPGSVQLWLNPWGAWALAFTPDCAQGHQTRECPWLRDSEAPAPGKMQNASPNAPRDKFVLRRCWMWHGLCFGPRPEFSAHTGTRLRLDSRRIT